MLHSLLQNDQVVMQPKDESLKLSFAQVTVYAVTNGRIKTPKSILLPTLIKSLTNNTEIINVINKLSHGVSFTVLMETHTENAYKILEQQLENTFILLLDCQEEEYTTMLLMILISRRKPCQVIIYIYIYFCIRFPVFTDPSVLPAYNF